MEIYDIVLVNTKNSEICGKDIEETAKVAFDLKDVMWFRQSIDSEGDIRNTLCVTLIDDIIYIVEDFQVFYNKVMKYRKEHNII